MELLFTILMLSPLILALWLANLSQRKRVVGEVQAERLLKLIAYGILALVYGGLLLMGLLFQGIGLLSSGGPGPQIVGRSRADAGGAARMALGMWLPSLLGLFMLTFARRLAARVRSNIDPAHLCTLLPCRWPWSSSTCWSPWASASTTWPACWRLPPPRQAC